MNESHLYRIAKRRVAFKNHLLTYIVVNTVFLAIDYFDNEKITWAFWPLLGWGIGVIFDAFNAYGVTLFSVEKEMEKLKRKQQQ